VSDTVEPPPELERCLHESGYTPPVRALEALLGYLITAPDEQLKPLEQSLARARETALEALLVMLPMRAPAERPRLYGLLVRCAGEVENPGLFETLIAALDEPVPASRKFGARGLAKLGDARAEAPLLARLGAAGTERKNIVDALGALGSVASLGPLGTLQSEDADLLRRRERARLMIERRAGRAAEPGALELDAPLPRPWRVGLSCRAGLAELLADELRELGGDLGWVPRLQGPTRVEIEHAGSLSQLLRSRLALDVALVMLPAPGGALPEQRIAASLALPEHLGALRAWTRGIPRFRVAWTHAGHRRALSWALARALRERTSELINDPNAAHWTLRASPDAVGELELVPRLDPDPRFAYRRADVPAASHPTIAAALVRFAGVRADDVVWDPFVGSGLELIERARRGPLRELWGSDTDPRALAAARLNLAAAGLQAQLVEQSALVFAPPAPTLIITNPPMGRRVARDGSLAGLLDTFLAHAARVLAPGGRLVWLSPLPERSERRAGSLGLSVVQGPDVDLGGFTARLQLFTRAS
jgi:hypothetical protein